MGSNPSCLFMCEIPCHQTAMYPVMAEQTSQRGTCSLLLLKKQILLLRKNLSPQTFTSLNTHKHTSPATLVHSFSHCSFLWMFPYFPTSAFSHKAVTHIIYFMYCAAIKNAAQPHERKKYITV